MSPLILAGQRVTMAERTVARLENQWTEAGNRLADARDQLAEERAALVALSELEYAAARP